MPIVHEAVELKPGLYAVRPQHQLGTMGWSPYPWTVVYVTARSTNEALLKSRRAIVQQMKKGILS